MAFAGAERLGDGQNSRLVMLARCVTRYEEVIETLKAISARSQIPRTQCIKLENFYAGALRTT